MGIFDFLLGKKQPASPQAQSQPRGCFEWRASEPHMLLLSRFLCAQDASAAALPANWEGVLGEPPQVAIDRFFNKDLLIPASVTAKLDSTFKAVDLKPFLKERGLPVSGKKDVLLDRLVTADPEGMAEKVAHLAVVECSADARAIAEQYRATKRTEKDAAISESLAFLRAREFGKASLTVSSYEAKQVFPRGVGIDWSRPDPVDDIHHLETLFSSRPKILGGLAEGEWEALRVAAAMMHLWGTNAGREWLPVGFVGVPSFGIDTSARMLMFHATHKREMAKFRALNVKSGIIRGCGKDSCEACQKIADKSLPLDRIPELPYAGCTCEMGCRCYVEPTLDM